MHLFWVRNLSQLIVHFLSVCYVLLGPLTFHHVSSRFDQVLPYLSSSVKVSYGEMWSMGGF